jgi:hypothetical protein
MILLGQNEILKDNLLFWYDFSRNSWTGSTIKDLSPYNASTTLSFTPNGNTFASNNCMTVIPGQFFSAVLPVTNVLDFTASFWIKANTSTIYQQFCYIGSGAYNLLFDCNDGDDGNTRRGIWVYWNSGGGKYSALPSTAPSFFMDDRWRHYTFRRSTTVAPYTDHFIDGKKITTTVNRGTVIPGDQIEPFFVAPSPLVNIGAFTNFSGKIGAGYGYNRALSDDEILYNYYADRNKFVVLDTDTLAYANALSVKPSEAYLKALDNFIRRLKVNNIWNKLDRLWIMAAETQEQCLRSIKNPTSTVASVVGSVNFSSTGVSSTSNGYINLNFNPNTNGVSYTTNNASYGAYVTQLNDISSVFTMGGWSLGGTKDANTYMTQITFGGAVNSSGGVITGGSFTAGLFTLGRTDGTTQYLTKNSSQITSSGYATTGLPDVNMYLLCRNSNGVATEFSQNKVGISFFGAGDIDKIKFYQIIQQFAIDRGFNV